MSKGFLQAGVALTALTEQFEREQFEDAPSRETLDAFLASCEDTGQDTAMQFVALLTVLPKLTEQFVQRTVATAAAEMPRAPGGRSRIDPDRRRKIVEAVGRLHRQGVAMGVAQARAAQQFGIAKRSVQRVWQQRKGLAEQPFQSIDDVWGFLLKLIED